MTHKAKRFLSCALAVLMAVLLVASVFTPLASAADRVNDYRYYRMNRATVKLTGREAEGKYHLTTKDLYLFSLEGTAPGDAWYGAVKVENDTETDMAICVKSITSTLLRDTALFNALDLYISVAGRTVYQGAYAVSGSAVTDYFMLRPGDVMFFDIMVSFPGTADNALQGRQMDSTWTFDAVFFEPKAELLDYTVYYVDQYFQELIPSKLGHGYPDEVITEYAADINGYEPDARYKQMLLAEDEPNVLYFVYYPKNIDTPPSDSIDPPGASAPLDREDIIDTGFDMSLSNTSMTPFLLIFLLALVAVVLTYLRIRSANKASIICTPAKEEQNKTSQKEDS